VYPPGRESASGCCRGADDDVVPMACFGRPWCDLTAIGEGEEVVTGDQGAGIEACGESLRNAGLAYARGSGHDDQIGHVIDGICLLSARRSGEAASRSAQ